MILAYTIIDLYNFSLYLCPVTFLIYTYFFFYNAGFLFLCVTECWEMIEFHVFLLFCTPLDWSIILFGSGSKLCCIKYVSYLY